MNNTRPVVVFGTKSDQNDNFLYVKEEDFQILAGAESFGIPLEHLMKIEKSVISSKTISEPIFFSVINIAASYTVARDAITSTV